MQTATTRAGAARREASRPAPTSRWLTLAEGALAGLIATGPMTAMMLAAKRALPRHQRYPLPPRQITARLASEARVDASEGQVLAAAGALHFFGAAAGAVFALLSRRSDLPPIAHGGLFGLLVWTVSYLGWVPALSILRPATEHPKGRNALMIAANVLWGAVTAWILIRRRG